MFIAIITFSLFQFVSPNSEAYAATYADGTYDISFEMKEAGSDNTSIADGYFTKPAKLVVKNGANYIQLTTNESDWIKSMSGPMGSATDVSESGNTRTVQFEVGDLSNPVNMKMHVVVPEEIAGMEYDHNHSVRVVFNADNIPAATNESAEESTEAKDEVEQVTAGADDTAEKNPKADDTTEKNPKTGDTTPIGVYVFLLLASIAVLVIYETRFAKN